MATHRCRRRVFASSLDRVLLAILVIGAALMASARYIQRAPFFALKREVYEP